MTKKRRTYTPDSRDLWNRVELTYRRWDQGEPLSKLLAGHGPFPKLKLARPKPVAFPGRQLKHIPTGVAGRYEPAMEFHEIGKRLGITAQAASQLYMSGMRKLRVKAIRLQDTADLAVELEALRRPAYSEVMAKEQWAYA